MCRRILVIVLLLCCSHSLPLCAQISWQECYERLVETSDDDEAEDLTLIYDALSEAAENPLNINTITADELRDLLCFSDTQIEAITSFVERYGPLRTKGELFMIPYLDEIRSGLLYALTFIGEGKEKTFPLDTLLVADKERSKLWRKASDNRAELVGFVHVPFYTRKGDDEGYAGNRYKHWLRGSYKVDRHMKIGFVAAQDAGEPFLTKPNTTGYDFYSAYVRLQKKGILKNAVIGRYRIRNGLGLILNSNVNFGKTFTSLPTSGSTYTSILPHSSRSEASYMQGAAATLSLTKHVETTLFASVRAIDATLTDDSLGIKTILRTGYHRTASELARRHNATLAALGANLRYSASRLSVGASFVWNRFSLPLQPYTLPVSLSQLYRVHAPTGQTFWNVSTDYSYRMGKLWSLAGETGVDNEGNIATVNTFSWRVANTLTLNGIQRFYPYRFSTIMGRSFSEGGSNQDESGLYVGAAWTPSSRVSINAYSDVAYFAWPKYQALGSSHSFDNFVQADIGLSRRSSLNVRYRIKLREKNVGSQSDGGNQGLAYRNEQRLRVAYHLRSGRWTMKSQADLAYCRHVDDSFGGMGSQTVTYDMKKLQIASGMGYFHTKDYNSRVYAYEHSTPYNLSFPSFYGHGCRAYVVMQSSPMPRLTLIAKLGITRYFDRDEIGSGLQLINGNCQSDLDVMLKWSL